jgi:drug/metabolite transporter (DMT)-like permease
MSESGSKIGSGLVLAVVGAIAFSGKAIIVKLAYRHQVDAVTLIMYRMLFALPFFLAMVWWSERKTAAGLNPLKPADWLGVIGLGFTGYYFSSFLDFIGLQYISASLERLILYLNPTLVMMLGWFLYRRPIQPIRALAMAVSYSGVFLVFGHEATLDGNQVVWGGFLVFLSALTYAVYLIYSGELVKRIGSLRLVGWASTVACICCILQFLILRPLDAAIVDSEVLWLSVINAVLCTATPVLLVMMAIERIGPGLTSQTGMIGPMSTIAMGVVVLGEPLNAWIGAGTLLVLSGIFIVSKYGAK